MKIELSKFEMACASLKLRGVSESTIVTILQEEQDFTLKVNDVELAIQRAGEKMKTRLEKKG